MRDPLRRRPCRQHHAALQSPKRRARRRTRLDGSARACLADEPGPSRFVAAVRIFVAPIQEARTRPRYVAERGRAMDHASRTNPRRSDWWPAVRASDKGTNGNEDTLRPSHRDAGGPCCRQEAQCSCRRLQPAGPVVSPGQAPSATDRRLRFLHRLAQSGEVARRRGPPSCPLAANSPPCGSRGPAAGSGRGRHAETASG